MALNLPVGLVGGGRLLGQLGRRGLPKSERAVGGLWGALGRVLRSWHCDGKLWSFVKGSGLAQKTAGRGLPGGEPT